VGTMARTNETPEERFKRLATSRTNAVLDKLRILGNLSTGNSMITQKKM
jgi:hypothetical protein